MCIRDSSGVVNTGSSLIFASAIYSPYFFFPILYLGTNSQEDLSLWDRTFIWDKDAFGSACSGFTIFKSSQSCNNTAIVFLRSISLLAILDSLPSNANSSLKCTMKYLPCLWSIWQDWNYLFSVREDIPILVRVSLTFRKLSGSGRVTSNIDSGDQS